jgi:hypothetical protein
VIGDPLTQDLVSILIIACGAYVGIDNLYLYASRRVFYRWMFLVSAVAGFGFAVTFVMSLCDGDDTITSAIGLPVAVVAVVALVLWTMLIQKITGGQNND